MNAEEIARNRWIEFQGQKTKARRAARIANANRQRVEEARGVYRFRPLPRVGMRSQG